MMHRCVFFFNDTATTEIYTLSLHDALPIWRQGGVQHEWHLPDPRRVRPARPRRPRLAPRFPRRRDRADVREHPRARSDRKSTRLNSSHANISYAVFCLKNKDTKSMTLIAYK